MITKFKIFENFKDEKFIEKYIDKYIIFHKNANSYPWMGTITDGSELYIGKIDRIGVNYTHIAYYDYDKYYKNNKKTPSYYAGVEFDKIKILGDFRTLDYAMEMYGLMSDMEKYNL